MITPNWDRPGNNTILFSLLVRHLIYCKKEFHWIVESRVCLGKAAKLHCSTNFKLLTNNFRKAYRLQILWKLLFYYLKVLREGTLQLAWSFTTSLNRNITIWWGFFRQTAPAAMPVHVGANSLKKPHHIVILWFSEVVR